MLLMYWIPLTTIHFSLLKKRKPSPPLKKITFSLKKNFPNRKSTITAPPWHCPCWKSVTTDWAESYYQ
jgi:hypothetical protein